MILNAFITKLEHNSDILCIFIHNRQKDDFEIYHSKYILSLKERKTNLHRYLVLLKKLLFVHLSYYYGILFYKKCTQLDTQL